MLKRTLIIPLLLFALAGVLAAGDRQKLGENAKEQPAKQETRKTRKPKQPPEETPKAPAVPYLTGEARVTVKGDQQPPIRIAMAPSGITIIELPAKDKFFAVHPPRNGDWVEIEKSPSMKSDTHLVLRAGKDLSAENGPAQLTMQMRSGLVLTFWIYPVKYITQQAHRCIITYSRDDIIAARRSAGLAVNLGEGEDETPTPKRTGNDAASKSFPPLPTLSPMPIPSPRREGEAAAVDESAGRRDRERKPLATARSEERIKALRTMLTCAVAEAKRFKRWTSATNGLSVSTRTEELDETTKVYLVAVKNVEDESLRLLSGHPDLVIESRDEKGKVIQLTPIKKLHLESTTANNVIPARATVYFAVAYEPPVLGKQQRVRVTVGQINAADDPVIAGLPANP
jgi:hypothetical protein